MSMFLYLYIFKNVEKTRHIFHSFPADYAGKLNTYWHFEKCGKTGILHY